MQGSLYGRCDKYTDPVQLRVATKHPVLYFTQSKRIGAVYFTQKRRNRLYAEWGSRGVITDFRDAGGDGLAFWFSLKRKWSLRWAKNFNRKARTVDSFNPFWWRGAMNSSWCAGLSNEERKQATSFSTINPEDELRRSFGFEGEAVISTGDHRKNLLSNHCEWNRKETNEMV